jgi:polysaccharide export outer membrane protein
LLLFVFSALPAQEEPDAYKLGAGDHIIIQVYDEPELSMDFRLNDSGILNYPLLGELQVAGLSLLELEKLISDGLRGSYLIDPDVTVSIEEYRSFFINGEVKNPGGYPYQPSLTVEKAVSLAGGFTERASRKNFTVMRADDPTKTVIDVSASDPVYPGDVITVSRSFF